MTYRWFLATLSRLLAGLLSVLMVFGDMPAFCSLPPSFQPTTTVRFDPPLPSAPFPGNVPDLRSLLAGIASVRPSTDDRPMLIHIRDIHGQPRAQRNIEAALNRLIAYQDLGSILLEGQAGNFDAALFRRSPDRETTDAVVAQLLAERRISGAAAALLSGHGPVPPVSGLEDETTYRANVAVLPAALAAGSSFPAASAPLAGRLDELKKKTFNADLYLTDLAVSRYEQGRMPLVSLLTLLHHRGATFDAAMSVLLRVQTLELLYDAADAGSELRQLVGRLRDRISPDEAAALFDAAFRFQKGTLRLDEFVALVGRLCRDHNVDLSAYPNIGLHLERALLMQSVGPDELYSAVEHLRPVVLEPLASTENERQLLAVDRRLGLLSKLAHLALGPEDWAELQRPMPPINEPEIAELAARVAELESNLEPAKNFYRLAEQRNDRFALNIRSASVAAGSRAIVVVAGGYHGDAIARLAASLGRRYVAVTPGTGDVRGWDSEAPLRELSQPRDDWEAALDARTQTLAPPPASASACARLAAVAIARGTLNGRPDLVQWGRNVLGYLHLSLDDVHVVRWARHATVRIQVNRRGVPSTLEVQFGPLGLAMTVINGFWHRTFGRLWQRLLRFYYGTFGVLITGRGLHTNQKVWVRVVPRPKGHGIYFVRKGRRIPGTITYLAPNRRRYTDVEDQGEHIITPEHFFAALWLLNIWDCDIYVSGGELPILDGSARPIVDALKPLANWSEPPPIRRIDRPYVFRRPDNRTAIIFLPLPENETTSHIIFVGDYGDRQKSPVEVHLRVGDETRSQLEAEVSPRPTFVENLAEQQSRGLFQAAVPYRPGQVENPDRARQRPMPNVIDATNPDDWNNGAIDLQGLAEHKAGIDVVGDFMFLEQELGYRIAGIGIFLVTGHRDNRIEAEMIASGLRSRVWHRLLADVYLGNLRRQNKISAQLDSEILGYLEPYKGYDMRLALDTLYEKNRISQEVHDRVMAEAEPYKDLDMEEAAQRLLETEKITRDLHDKIVSAFESPYPQDIGPLSPDVVERLSRSFHWAARPPHDVEPKLADIQNYFMRNGGTALVDVSQNVASQQFLPAQIQHIDVQLWDESPTEQTFLVAFSRGNDRPGSQPKVAVIMSRQPGSEPFADAVVNARRANDANELVRRRRLGPSYRPRVAADRDMEYFPKPGMLKTGIYAREWLASQYARYAPRLSAEALSPYDGEIPFEARWEDRRGTGQLVASATPEQVARAAGQMLADGFLRLAPPRASNDIPTTGFLIDDIDFTRDFLYDPVDGRAGLAIIRRLREVRVEEFLHHALHLQLTMNIQRQSKFAPAPGRRIRKEWQPFATNTKAVLAGIETALENAFPQHGKQVALVWYKRYLAALREGPQGPLVGLTETEQTWKYRMFLVESQYITRPGTAFPAPGSSIEQLRTSIPGEAIRPIIEARIATLESDVRRDEVFGAVRWLARGVAFLFNLPLEIAVRLSPITEAVSFSAAGLVAFHLFVNVGIGQANVLGAGVSAAAMLLAWRISHQSVLSFGPTGYAWTPFARLPLGLRMRILGLGSLVAALPPIAYALGGAPFVILTVLITTIIHWNFNPKPSGTGWAGGAVPLLDLRQRVRRNLEGQV